MKEMEKMMVNGGQHKDEKQDQKLIKIRKKI